MHALKRGREEMTKKRERKKEEDSAQKCVVEDSSRGSLHVQRRTSVTWSSSQTTSRLQQSALCSVAHRLLGTVFCVVWRRTAASSHQMCDTKEEPEQELEESQCSHEQKPAATQVSATGVQQRPSGQYTHNSNSRSGISHHARTAPSEWLDDIYRAPKVFSISELFDKLLQDNTESVWKTC
ncbi:hypothetical protein WMY93_012695 [Mugilogobius chulae]|uniref:Uncharacterized protein n=1 Tax=Mugilogobius chulae TaxID=88201 RepID=A0AAW0P1F5_9GOBI